MFKLTITSTAAALLLGISASATAQTKLLLSTFFPPTHPVVEQVLVPWSKDIASATQNRVQIEFSSSSLAPPPGQLDMVQRGIADVSLQYTGVVPNRLPLLMLNEVPGTVSSSAAMTTALWNTNERYLHKGNQLNGLHLLASPVFPPQAFFCVKEGAFDLDQLKGVKIATTPGTSSRQWGSITSGVVAGPVVRYFESVSKGIVDAYTALTPIEAVSFNLAPHTKCIMNFPELDTAGSFVLVVNEKKWGTLSADDRTAIMKLSGANFGQRMAVMDTANQSALKKLAEGGVKNQKPSPATVAALKTAWEPLLAEWLKIAADKGVDGKAALQHYQDQLARAK
jgi:TRAP-type C4-dicarboxylate transport system substrate-binding protein